MLTAGAGQNYSSVLCVSQSLNCCYLRFLLRCCPPFSTDAVLADCLHKTAQIHKMIIIYSTVVVHNWFA